MEGIGGRTEFAQEKHLYALARNHRGRIPERVTALRANQSLLLQSSADDGVRVGFDKHEFFARIHVERPGIVKKKGRSIFVARAQARVFVL